MHMHGTVVWLPEHTCRMNASCDWLCSISHAPLLHAASRARARLPRNVIHFRFWGANLAKACCMPWARPKTISRQSNNRKLHLTGQISPYSTNQTRPYIAYAGHVKTNKINAFVHDRAVKFFMNTPLAFILPTTS